MVLKHAAIYPDHEKMVGQLAAEMGFKQVRVCRHLLLCLLTHLKVSPADVVSCCCPCPCTLPTPELPQLQMHSCDCDCVLADTNAAVFALLTCVAVLVSACRSVCLMLSCPWSRWCHAASLQQLTHTSHHTYSGVALPVSTVMCNRCSDSGGVCCCAQLLRTVCWSCLCTHISGNCTPGDLVLPGSFATGTSWQEVLAYIKCAFFTCVAAGMLLPFSQGLTLVWTRCSCCSCRVMGDWLLSTRSVDTKQYCQDQQVRVHLHSQLHRFVQWRPLFPGWPLPSDKHVHTLALHLLLIVTLLPTAN